MLFTNGLEIANHRTDDVRSAPKVTGSGLQVRGIVLRALLLATPIALLGLASLDVVVRGWNVVAVVATNLPTPPSALGKRMVDLVHRTAPEGRVYRIDLVRRAGPDARRLDGARVQLYLSSQGKTRVLFVEQETADASRSNGLLAALRGRATLQVVDDGGWVDLGPLPAGETRLHVQVVGLLPGPFGFAELDRPESPAFERIDIALAATDRSVVTTVPRYRVVRDAAVTARESLARVGFFLTASAILLVCALLAVVGLCVGWMMVSGARTWVGILLLVSSVTLLHAALLPPLQGADETSQIGTIEWLVSDPSPSRTWRFPESISLVSRALEQDRVQFHPWEPLPIAGASARGGLRGIMRSSLASESTAMGTPPPAADLQVVSWRAPLFYAPYRTLAGVFRGMSVADRIAAYRLAATVWALLAFAGGLALLRWARLPAEIALVYGLTFLVPYTVATSATCSNYAPAIGLGFLVAAGVVVAVLSPAESARWTGGAVVLAAAWAGIPIWPDFVGLAALASAAAFGVAVWTLLRRLSTRPGAGATLAPTWSLLVPGAMVAAAVLIAWWNFPGVDTRLTALAPAWGDPGMLLRAALVAGPFALALLAAAARYVLRGAPLGARRRLAFAVAAATALVLAVMFAVTPYTEVPYEKIFLPLPDLVRAHVASFWASNFSFDQDRLGWKFLFGTFGWHDAFYPEPVYALARWGFVALLVALPVLTVEFAHRRPAASSVLILASGAGLSLCAATLLVRHAMAAHPHGRFILPYLPLVALPVLAQLATPAHRRALILALRCGVALNVWTAVAVLGARYSLPG